MITDNIVDKVGFNAQERLRRVHLVERIWMLRAWLLDLDYMNAMNWLFHFSMDLPLGHARGAQELLRDG